MVTLPLGILVALANLAAARWALAASGSAIPYCATSARAWANVVASATVGPEAMVPGSSPGTSEIASVTTRAGCAAAASLPPENAERCFRTQFMAPIGAPLRSNSRLTAIMSSSVRPADGRVESEDPPPEISASTRSSGVSPCISASISAAAAAPAASGVGWLPKRSAMRDSARPAPCGATTSPSSGPSQARSTASAILAAALPAPTTMVRPRGFFGRCGARQVSGSAAAMAACHIPISAAWARLSSQLIPALLATTAPLRGLAP